MWGGHGTVLIKSIVRPKSERLSDAMMQMISKVAQYLKIHCSAACL